MNNNNTRMNLETEGPTWAQRAKCGELGAVFSPEGTERRNLFLHTISLVAANRALALRRNPGVLLDFGCGTGRMLRFFAAHGWSVIGTEITREMLAEARRFGLPDGAQVYLTDGVTIPLPSESVDMIWVCGVLKYSLVEPGAVSRGGANAGETTRDPSFVPVYRDIAREMYRVLKTGGWVVNNEVYVDAAPAIFTRDFEDVGFVTQEVRVLQRHFEPFSKLLQSPRVPRWLVTAVARFYASNRLRFDDAQRASQSPRDYLFVWCKPKN